jgi:ribosomal-protein-alanine N-acetyltransferase
MWNGRSTVILAACDGGVNSPEYGRRMGDERMTTRRLLLRPLPAAAAQALPGDRRTASRLLGAKLAETWPQPDVLDVLPRQAAAVPEEECFGVWVLIERSTNTVVGDAGFVGLPDSEGTVEIGYAVVPGRRRRGYATEAAAALVEWALARSDVHAVVAGCAPDNSASVAILERLGFVPTGERDGELRWRRGGSD